MVRSLWTAATGMTAQQTNVDVISNNLANVNTTGYKGHTAQFKTLLYQTVQSKTTSANGDTKPVGAQVGLGVRNSAVTTDFTQGNLTDTGINTDFAIEGKGFFAIQGIDGETYYTRNGAFNFSIGNNGMVLSTAEGYPVLDENGDPIELDATQYQAEKLSINADGQICYPDANNNPQPIGVTIGLVQFPNPNGLEKLDESLYKVTDASGEARWESEDDSLKKSKVYQGYLEASNVQVVDEMVGLIVAQRAYEMNSKVITTTDEMMSQANQLKR